MLEEEIKLTEEEILRTNNLIKYITSLFGKPNWNTKEMDESKIKAIFYKEIFQHYEDNTIKEALYELFKYSKVSKFPTMAQLQAMLYNKGTKDFTENNTTVDTTNTNAFLQWSENIIRNNLGLTSYDTEQALHNTVNRIDLEFPPTPEEKNYRTVGNLANLGIINNVFWKYLDEEMDKIIKEKLSYLESIRKE